MKVVLASRDIFQLKQIVMEMFFSYITYLNFLLKADDVVAEFIDVISFRRQQPVHVSTVIFLPAQLKGRGNEGLSGLFPQCGASNAPSTC